MSYDTSFFYLTGQIAAKKVMEIFIVQFNLLDDVFSFQKSTGTLNRAEAEKIAMNWLENSTGCRTFKECKNRIKYIANDICYGEL